MRWWQSRLALGMVAVLVVAAFVLTLGERGAFTRMAARSSLTPIPGLTVDDDSGNAASDNAMREMPVVTSLRSNSEAERLGVLVGDHIRSVDGHPVHDVAAIRAAIGGDTSNAPLALHIQRGNAVWTVAIDRTEPVRDAPLIARQHHDPQNSAG